MAKWLVEEGIGEHRAIQLGPDGIEEARIFWPGTRLVAGEIADAKLRERIGEGGRGRVEFPSGEQAFAAQIPRSVSIGAPVRMQVTREAIAERGRFKLAQSRFSDAPVRPGPALAQSLVDESHEVELIRRFPDQADWQELWLDAASQKVTFDGGSLLFAETPAMTLIDVDGSAQRAAQQKAVAALAKALRRFDLGGNIGVDFPSVQDKADRKAIDTGLAECLDDWPHERTAMNGFGFVQIVTRLSRPSLIHRIARNRSGAAARLLLRRAEVLEGPGKVELSAHPAVLAAIEDNWLEELTRRTGKEVSIRPDPGLALEASHAQLVTR
ncbi:ribonuclease E/G [Aurantiacibacter marinus]|uniref:RNA-binding protein AU-1/Ribonuclease E/G domain-containing protein n=1 Tax=Aurantiacibacter marinus TaxID=874156 RepID=A0A0H0XL49_9SPHN|nr:ribonuclease E/G [Aurantiacibacter marinus]KLI63288.1 hypothetical protein AAV99_11520 [Aurantiacibacter marinus]